MTIDIQIGDYPTQWSRRASGLFWPVHLTSDKPIRAVEFSMEGDGSGPFRMEFPGRKDGRWFYGTAWKPEINGTWWPLVKAFETLDNEGPKSMRRGPHKVTVTEDAVFLPADPAGPAPFQIRAAFYYPWFVGPQGWGTIGTRYHPTLGRYDLLNMATIDAHVRALEYGRFHAAIASWWGQGSVTDGRVSALLERSEGHALRWALYYEFEGHTNPTVEQLKHDLAYIRDRYASHPNYLRIGGRFVVFVYSADDRDCSVTARWKQANDRGDFYIVLEAVNNYEDCQDQPDGWHKYGPAGDVQTTWDNAGRIHSYNISPGFWSNENASAAPLLTRDLTRWNKNIRDMIASNARWQMTIFNEWGEGTSIESADEWASPSGFGLYLDALHANGEG